MRSCVSAEVCSVMRVACALCVPRVACVLHVACALSHFYCVCCVPRVPSIRPGLWRRLCTQSSVFRVSVSEWTSTGGRVDLVFQGSFTVGGVRDPALQSSILHSTTQTPEHNLTCEENPPIQHTSATQPRSVTASSDGP